MIIHQNKKFVKRIDKFEFLLYNKTTKVVVRRLCQRLLRKILKFLFNENRRQLGAEGGFCTYFRLWL